MKKIFVSAVFCLLMLSITAGAQTYEKLPNIMTSEAAALGKFGAYPVSYYTGAVNVSVPLYTIKEKDISLDVTLQSSTSGFVPNMEDGTTGLNWSLSAGGVITRQVNWSPDDMNVSDQGNLNNNMNANKGYIYGMLQANLGIYSKNYIRTLGFLNLSNPSLPTSNLPYEYSPDVFSFNFNGHSGRFFLGNDGVVKVSSDRNYKVSFSSMSGQSDLCNCNSSSIAITTDEGDIYTFGGDINALQITYPYQGDGRSISCTDGVINAWYLKSIQTHNGTTITFTYEPQSKFDLAEAGNQNSFPHGILDYAYEKVYISEKMGVTALAGGEESNSTAGQPPSRSLLKTVYLSSITTPTTRIEFTYSQKSHEFYGSGTIVNHHKPKQLDKIQVKDAAGASVRNITMDYIAYGSSSVGYRNFLSKVNFNDVNNNGGFSYQFDYYKTSTLPNPLTKGIDLWGYYNGNDGNSSLIPSSNSGAPNYDVTFTGRSASGTLCDMGLLKRITYPTGGWSEFTYEGHNYSKVLRKTVQGGLTPAWFNINGSAGGARVQQITNSEGITQSFFYKKNYDPNDPNAASLPSSGVLTDHDIFFLDLIFPHNQYPYNQSPYNGYAENSIIQDNNIAASSSYGETPIGYSEVTESVTGNGYTKYYYSTQETNPDIYVGSNTFVLTPGSDPSTTNYSQQMKRLVKYSICDMERGKLLKTAVYKNENNTSTLLRETINQYNTDSLRYDQSVIGFNFPHYSAGWAIYHSYALYYFQNNITQQTMKEYFANGKTSTTTVSSTYISNSNPLLRSQSQMNSKGDTKTVTYKYPTDFSSTAPYNSMVAKNMVSPIIEQLTYKNNVNFLSSIKTNYNYWAGTSWNINTTSGLILPQNIQTKTLNQSSYETRASYDAYDISGNLTAFSKPGDLQRSYVWGYHKLYPIANVANSTPDKIAYTSFEDEDLGGWTLTSGSVTDISPGFTGKKGYSGTIYKDVPQGNYVVTLWSKTLAAVHSVNGLSGTPGPIKGQWQLYTYAITNGTHITVTADTADEIRLYPTGAQMTTYTYDPLIGVSSQTDLNNRTTYYQYDAFGRLLATKDQNGKILKKYCYNYAGQPEQCNFYTSDAINGDYYSQNCSSGQIPVSYHVSVPQGMFMSYLDQQTANQLAQQYAQTQANQHGNCQIANVSIYGENNHGASISIQMHNIASGQDYWFSIDPHGSDILGDLPPGNYNITITPSFSGYYYYSVGCGYYNDGPAAITFYGVDINSSCSSISID